jgi:hypothetical protein
LKIKRKVFMPGYYPANCALPVPNPANLLTPLRKYRREGRDLSETPGTFRPDPLSTKRTRLRKYLQLSVVVLVLIPVSCATHGVRPLGPFQVVRATPEYLLRAPDASTTPFPELLDQYRNRGAGWVDLKPQMELHLEAAYYREGSPKRTIADYLGTETARFQVRPNGQLGLTSTQSGLKESRGKQIPARQLVRTSQRSYRHGRFFYAVGLNRKGQTRGAVLLGAGSAAELDRLTKQLLTNSESVCGGASTHCTVFPETCTASIDIGIVVNGVPRSVTWGNLLESVAPRPLPNPSRIEMLRLDAGNAVPVEIDAADPAALKLPLLPGDRITWQQAVN